MLNPEYPPSRKVLEPFFISYGPLLFSKTLESAGILNRISNYIMTTLKDISISYQSSVLYDLLMKDLANLNKQKAFIIFLRKEGMLKDIYKEMKVNGKIISGDCINFESKRYLSWETSIINFCTMNEMFC